MKNVLYNSSSSTSMYYPYGMLCNQTGNATRQQKEMLKKTVEAYLSAQESPENKQKQQKTDPTDADLSSSALLSHNSFLSPSISEFFFVLSFCTASADPSLSLRLLLLHTLHKRIPSLSFISLATAVIPRLLSHFLAPLQAGIRVSSNKNNANSNYNNKCAYMSTHDTHAVVTTEIDYYRSLIQRKYNNNNNNNSNNNNNNNNNNNIEQINADLVGYCSEVSRLRSLAAEVMELAVQRINKINMSYNSLLMNGLNLFFICILFLFGYFWLFYLLQLIFVINYIRS